MKKPIIVFGIAAVSVAIIWAFFLVFVDKKEKPAEVKLPREESTPAPQEKNTVTIRNFAFDPQTLTIKVGETVSWVNDDGAVHTIKSTDFASPNIKNKESYKFQFTKAGTFEYNCGVHPYMKGKVVVE